MNSRSKTYDLVCGRFRTHLMEAGKEGAPVVFLLHDGGLGGDSLLSWADVIEELNSDFHLFALDFYGFGRSDMVFEFGRRAYESHLEQVADVVRSTGISAAHFVGASYGGSVIVRAAAQPALPWPMLGGVSIGGAGGVYRPESAKQLLAATEPTQESVEQFVGLLAAHDWPSIEQHIKRRLGNALLPGHWEALAAPRLRCPVTTRKETDDEFPSSLSSCPVPILLVEGRKDQLLEKNWAERLARCAPLGRAVQLDSHHCPNLDQAPLIANLLRDFIRSCSAERKSIAQN